MEKRIIAIGGGEIRNKTTLKIDEYVANLAKTHAGEKRANALFIGTASHDSMPYFNSFRKTYTSVFDIKVDVALIVYGEMDIDHIKAKFDLADAIYIGGGDTVFMMDHWKKSGLLPLIKSAYERGTIIAGVSAGAICWFTNIYTDSLKTENGDKYAMFQGLGWLKGVVSPHYNQRLNDFDEIVVNRFDKAIGIEDNVALLIQDEKIVGTISSGGNAYALKKVNGLLEKERFNQLN